MTREPAGSDAAAGEQREQQRLLAVERPPGEDDRRLGVEDPAVTFRRGAPADSA